MDIINKNSFWYHSIADAINDCIPVDYLYNANIINITVDLNGRNITYSFYNKDNIISLNSISES